MKLLVAALSICASRTRRFISRRQLMGEKSAGASCSFELLDPPEQLTSIMDTKSQGETRAFLGLKSASDNDETHRKAVPQHIYSCSTFLDTIRHALTEEDIFPSVRDSEDIVMILGISGSCDSVGLLHALVQLDLPNVNLRAIHFDYKERDVDSDGDR